MDGKPWRRVPDEVVVRCGLAAGTALDRPLLRRLRGELVRTAALSRAGRALARRPLSERRLAERLEQARLPPSARRSAIGTLKETGLVDDARLAEARACILAERGWGDSSIAARLQLEGIPELEARAAIDTLAPEPERAMHIVAKTDDRRKAWALLTRRGFTLEAIESALGALDEEG